MNLQWGTVFYLSNGAQDIFFSGNVLFQPNRFFFTILCRRWRFNMYMNMFSMKEISASWKLFLSNSMLRVSFFRCFFLSESGLFLSESCLSNPFLISLSRPFSTNFFFKIFRLKIYIKIARTFSEAFQELQDEHYPFPIQCINVLLSKTLRRQSILSILSFWVT